MLKIYIISLFVFLCLPLNGQTQFENCETARKKYLENNPDVKAANIDPWSHFMYYGKNEGRKWYSCNPEVPINNKNVDSLISKLELNTQFNVVDTMENYSNEIGLSKVINKRAMFYTNNFQNIYGEWTGKRKDGLVNGEGIMKIFENGVLVLTSYCTYEKGYKQGNSHDSSISYVFTGNYFNGLKVGKGKIVKIDESSYEGDWSNDQINGYGKYIWSNGDVYIGDWKDGKRNGFGKCIFHNGDSFIGNWFNDKKNGSGKYFWANGDIYDGDWKDGYRQGKGKVIYISGNYYDGNWQNDNRNGFGKSVKKNGDFYEGNWINGMINGKGSEVRIDGFKYTGDWLNGERSGFGKAIKPNGDYYEGEWKNGWMNGKGKEVNIHGSTYEGDWKDGKINGKCKQTLPNGDYYSGDWKDDNRNGLGVYVWSNGDQYSGSWKDGMRHGDGRNTYITGDFYDGRWENDKKNGYGWYFWPDGHSLSGYWKDNKMNGSGVESDPDGSYYEGEWKDGELISKKNERGPTKVKSDIVNSTNSNQNVPKGKTDSEFEKELTIVQRALSKLSSSETQYFNQVQNMNDDPQKKIGNYCGIAYTKCEWCGKSFSFNKKWQSNISLIQQMNSPFFQIYAGFTFGFAGILTGTDMTADLAKEIKSELANIKSGNIYTCSDVDKPKLCSKKCECEKKLNGY